MTSKDLSSSTIPTWIRTESPTGKHSRVFPWVLKEISLVVLLGVTLVVFLAVPSRMSSEFFTKTPSASHLITYSWSPPRAASECPPSPSGMPSRTLAANSSRTLSYFSRILSNFTRILSKFLQGLCQHFQQISFINYSSSIFWWCSKKSFRNSPKGCLMNSFRIPFWNNKAKTFRDPEIFPEFLQILIQKMLQKIFQHFLRILAEIVLTIRCHFLRRLV